MSLELLQEEKEDKNSKNIAVKIISDVKKNGDKAVVKYEKKYNKNTKNNNSTM